MINFKPNSSLSPNPNPVSSSVWTWPFSYLWKVPICPNELQSKKQGKVCFFKGPHPTVYFPFSHPIARRFGILQQKGDRVSRAERQKSLFSPQCYLFMNLQQINFLRCSIFESFYQELLFSCIFDVHQSKGTRRIEVV